MRTKQSIRNIISIIAFNLIIGVLGFLKVKVFVNGLSNDLYSLNQLFFQIFSYIAITDIGFGLIINKYLYEAFAKNDKDKVNKIYSTSRKFYKTIAFIMMGLSVIVCAFIQYLTKADIHLSYMRIIFLVFMLKNIVDYFFIAPRCVLEADQKLYLVNRYVKAIRIIENVLEMILVLCGVDYLIVIIPGLFVTIIIDAFVNRKIYKLYPWLKDENTFDKNYLKGTKDVIWKKLAGLLNSNTDIILISAIIKPISVIIYTSYNYVIKFVVDTVTYISFAITPSFANLVIKENKNKSYSVFKEMNMLFLFIASFVFIMFYGFLNPLIVFWIGNEYLVNSITLIMFIFIGFQTITEKPIAIVINSKGLFKETKVASILEALVNIVISIILIIKIGLIGALIGTIVSKLFITFIQNVRYIYNNIFKEKVYKYYVTYFTAIIINLLFVFMFDLISLNIANVFIWMVYVVLFAILVFIILFVIYYILFKSFKDVVYRGIELVKFRKKRVS